jgi:hypothetical protein
MIKKVAETIVETLRFAGLGYAVSYLLQAMPIDCLSVRWQESSRNCDGYDIPKTGVRYITRSGNPNIGCRLRIPRMPAGDSSRCRSSVPCDAGPGVSRTLILSLSS